jgi:hypothetical protein
MLFEEIIAVYSKNHIKYINTIREQNSALVRAHDTSVIEGHIVGWHCLAA